MFEVHKPIILSFTATLLTTATPVSQFSVPIHRIVLNAQNLHLEIKIIQCKVIGKEIVSANKLDGNRSWLDQGSTS